MVQRPGRQNVRVYLNDQEITAHVENVEYMRHAPELEAEYFPRNAPRLFQDVAVRLASPTYEVRLTVNQELFREIARQVYRDMYGQAVHNTPMSWTVQPEGNHTFSGMTSWYTGPATVDETTAYPPGHHSYVQDPDTAARLCATCGMWPEHHNHCTTRTSRACVCSDCHPDVGYFPDGPDLTLNDCSDDVGGNHP